MASYTVAEVRKHKSKDSLWVAVSGKVYDVTGFLERHPGGWEILADHGGGDVSSVMRDGEALHSHRHTTAAYEMLKKYYIGELEDKSRVHVHANGTGKQNGTSNGTTVHKATNGVANGTSGRTRRAGTEDTAGNDLQGWREEELIDWSRPLMWQVGKLGKDYMEWVHSPVDKHVRLFNSDLAEFFTDTPWWMIPIVWFPTMFAFLYCGFINFERGPIIIAPTMAGGAAISTCFIPLIVILGIISWTLMEYTLHRWLFHLVPPAGSPVLITMHFLLHGQHHKAPFDKERLVFPPVPATLFALGFWVGYSSIVPRPVVQCLMAGTILGYVCYDLTHYYLHHGGTPWLTYFKSLKSYHVKHHFVDQQRGFGISSKLWDYPFNTVIPDNMRRNIKKKVS